MSKQKLYYSIAEVAELTEISHSKLRFWEKEFRQLKPKRNSKGTRFYTEDDITLVKQIIFLTEDKKLTLDGAKKALRTKKSDVELKQEVIERLDVVRSDLMEMIRLLRKDDW